MSYKKEQKHDYKHKVNLKGEYEIATVLPVMYDWGCSMLSSSSKEYAH